MEIRKLDKEKCRAQKFKVTYQTFGYYDITRAEWGFEVVHQQRCIDKSLIEDIIGCKYCYANYSEESVVKNCSKYDPNSPILCGVPDVNDKITERKVKSLKEQQLSIFDL